MATRRGAGKTRRSSLSTSSKTTASLARSSPMASRQSDTHRAAVTEVVNGLRRIVRTLHQSHRVAEQRWDVSAAQMLVLQRLAESPTLSVNGSGQAFVVNGGAYNTMTDVASGQNAGALTLETPGSWDCRRA